ncbi:hypothetical protein DFH06DRAFT_510103 [Mycena polygramma]|nr:hypothetical protein DFH06DRAFT_510103 [Mycena polygramma]
MASNHHLALAILNRYSESPAGRTSILWSGISARPAGGLSLPRDWRLGRTHLADYPGPRATSSEAVQDVSGCDASSLTAHWDNICHSKPPKRRPMDRTIHVDPGSVTRTMNCKNAVRPRGLGRSMHIQSTGSDSLPLFRARLPNGPFGFGTHCYVHALYAQASPRVTKCTGSCRSSAQFTFRQMPDPSPTPLSKMLLALPHIAPECFQARRISQSPLKV